MNKRIYLMALAALLLSASTYAQNKPNFIFIFCDDLNVAGQVLGGHYQAQIPNIESLREQGVEFSNAHSNAPICGPSRASIFCGQYPHTTGLHGYNMNGNVWSSNPVIQQSDQIFEHFKEQGYSVYAGGKTYHGGTEFNKANMYTDYGVYPDHGPWPWDGVTMQWGKPKPLPHPDMPEVLQSSAYDGIASLENVPTIDGYTGWANNEGAFRFVSDSDRDLMTDELLADYADSLLQLSHSDPFFMTLGIMRPHTPLYVPQKYFDMYPLETIAIPGWMENDLDDIATTAVNNGWSGRTGVTKHQKFVELSADSTDKKSWVKRYIQGYLAGVTFVDDQIGKIMTSLENSAYSENTYIILTSDHGFHLGEKDLLFKWSLWDAATRVPFIVTGPNVPAFRSTSQPISLVDVYPTLVDLAGISQPSQTLDGFSIAPLMEDPDNGTWSGPDVALTTIAALEPIPLHSIPNKDHQHYSVRSERYRYTLTSAGEEELYDHEVDSMEYFNLAYDPNYASVKAELKAQMIAITGHSPMAAEGPEENVLFYGGFEQQLNGWGNSLQNGASATFEIDEVELVEGAGALKITVASTGGSNNNVQLINENVGLVHDQTYEVSFWAKATTDGAELSVHNARNGIPDWRFWKSSTFQLTDEWREYSYLYTNADSTSKINNRLYFRFHVEETFWIDEVKIKPIDAGDLPLICDGNFEGFGSDWLLSLTEGGTGSGGITTDEAVEGTQAYEAEILTGGANPWSNLLLSCSFDLVADHDYELSFWSKTGSSDLTAAVQVGMSDAPYTNYLNRNFSLTTSWQKFTYEFTSPVSLPAGGRLKVQLPNPGTYYFDDVQLVDKTVAAGVHDSNVYHDFVQVFPNPTYGVLHVANDGNDPLIYTLFDATLTSKKSGRLNGATEEKVDLSLLPKGVYFMQLQSANTTSIRRISVN